MSKVYIRIQNGLITAINSSEFLSDTTNWTQIDEGDGDRYHHAQGNYLPKPLVDEQGRYRYKLVNGAVVERTAEELEPVENSPSTPTLDERTTALETATEQQAAALDKVVTLLEAII